MHTCTPCISCFYTIIIFFSTQYNAWIFAYITWRNAGFILEPFDKLVKIELGRRIILLWDKPASSASSCSILCSAASPRLHYVPPEMLRFTRSFFPSLLLSSVLIVWLRNLFMTWQHSVDRKCLPGPNTWERSLITTNIHCCRNTEGDGNPVPDSFPFADKLCVTLWLEMSK